MKVMTLLLDRRGDQITITEKVVKTAAGNRGCGKEVTTLLFNWRGHHINVTEQIVKAAATSGQDKVLDLLSQQNTIISNWDKWRCISKFFNAAKAVDIRCIKQLIHQGTNPDMKGDQGITPLYIAAKYGHEAVVEVLAQRTDVNVNSKTPFGRSPLYWPSSMGYERVVAILMEAGADPSFVDGAGDTAVTAARQHGHERIVQILEKLR
jgi:ankyrin repeat protein